MSRVEAVGCGSRAAGQLGDVGGEGLGGDPDAFGHGQVGRPCVGDLGEGLAEDVDPGSGELAVTVSVGGGLCATEADWAGWYSEADAALYQAKGRGGDSCCLSGVYNTEPQGPAPS